MEARKIISILLISFASAHTGIAQLTDNGNFDYVRTQVTNIISLGFGTGGYYPYVGTSSLEIPNISLSYERALYKDRGLGNIFLGGLFSFKSIYNYTYITYYNYPNTTYDYEQRWNYYIVGARASYHIQLFDYDKTELYAGGMIAYYITSFNLNTNDPNTADPADPAYSLTTRHSPSFFAPGVFAGLRSWMTSHADIWFELGYGYTTMAFGLGYKI